MSYGEKVAWPSSIILLAANLVQYYLGVDLKEQCAVHLETIRLMGEMLVKVAGGG